MTKLTKENIIKYLITEEGMTEELANNFAEKILKKLDILEPFLQPDNLRFNIEPDISDAKDSLTAKEFHRCSVPELLLLNDKKYHLAEEDVLAWLENDRLYKIYKKYLKNKELNHSTKNLHMFLDRYLITISK